MLADGERTVLTRAHGWCLLAATALAAVLRFCALGDWSLWVDEAHTWRDATMPLSGDGGFLGTARAFYPLTFLLLRGLFALGLGQDAASMRLPFVLIGIATVPLLGVCGRRLVGAWPAVLAAVFLAVHPWHVYWSQNARGYVVVVLAAVVTADRVFVYVRHDRLRDLFAVWAAIAVGALSHATGLLLAAGFVAFLVLRARPLDRRRVARLVVGAVLLAVALPWMVENLTPFQEFMRSKDSPSLAHFVQTTGFYFRPIVLLAAAVGLWQLRHFGGRDRALALGSLSAVAFGVLLVIGSRLVLTTARYAICALPIVTWLAAFAAAQLAAALLRVPGAAKWPRRLAAALLPLLVVGEHTWSLADYYTVQHGQRARWSEAAAYLREQAAGRPIRVATVNHPTLLYYLRPGQWAFQVPKEYAANRVVPLIDWMVELGVDEDKKHVCDPGAVAHIAWHREAARASRALFAFVVTMPELVEQDHDGRLRAAITQECHLVRHLPCWVGPKDESIYVYVLKNP